MASKAGDRKSTRLNSSHLVISYAVFCLKKKKKKDVSIENRTLNARSETVTTAPAFRDSILTKRCLIPANGFYEWRKMGSVKQPYCFEVGEGEVFAFAGLWDEWRSPDGEIIESCTILTIGPNALVADLHDRMPVIVTRDKYDGWLDH